MHGTLIHGLPASHAIRAEDDPELTIRRRLPGILCRRPRCATRVRMIATNHRKAAIPRSPMRADEDSRINLETVGGRRRNIGSGRDLPDAITLAEQKSAHLDFRGRVSQRAQAGQQFA